MTFTLPAFGQDADEYVPVVFDENDIWIKKFKEGTHRLRLLQEPTKFVTYREHYDGEIKKTFPCTEDTQTCLGCTSDKERTRKRPRQFAFNALDDQGRLNLYKVGTGVKDDLVDEMEDNGGTLLDRDVVIIRKGTTLDDTRYKVKLGDKYDVEFTEDIHNIKKVLADHYLQALEASGVDIEGLLEGPTDAAHEEPVAPKKAAAKKTAAKAAPVEEPADPEDSVEDWPLSKLKAYCEKNKIEFPDRGGRAVLEPLVKEHLEGPPF
jgi:hypothetical protein